MGSKVYCTGRVEFMPSGGWEVAGEGAIHSHAQFQISTFNPTHRRGGYLYNQRRFHTHIPIQYRRLLGILALRRPSATQTEGRS